MIEVFEEMVTPRYRHGGGGHFIASLSSLVSIRCSLFHEPKCSPIPVHVLSCSADRARDDGWRHRALPKMRGDHYVP